MDKGHVLMSTSRGRGRPSGHPLTLTDVQAVFHLPRASAAEVYGYKTTAFMNACRHLGVLQWPYQRSRAGGKVSSVLQDSVDAHVETPALVHPLSHPARPTHLHWTREDNGTVSPWLQAMMNLVRTGGEAGKKQAVRQALLARYKTAELNYTYLKVCSSEHRVWHALQVGAQEDFPWLLLDVSMDAALATPRYAAPGAALNSYTDGKSSILCIFMCIYIYIYIYIYIKK